MMPSHPHRRYLWQGGILFESAIYRWFPADCLHVLLIVTAHPLTTDYNTNRDDRPTIPKLHSRLGSIGAGMGSRKVVGRFSSI